ncbi:MAG: hypothetical protein PG981_000327 [Wolbachia endosymbiont of Ctenocephalides orientis wCori]|nr:MAG: hypothetical protein PG981_000327 [Wolbachia endosymbiont of Ctenocephalides orientis wCori]
MSNLQDLVLQLHREARDIAEEHKEIFSKPDDLPMTYNLGSTTSNAIIAYAPTKYVNNTLNNVRAINKSNFIEGCNELINQVEGMITNDI